MPEYLSLSQAMEITGLDRSALLRAEERGELGQVDRTGGGHRRYTRDQLEGVGVVQNSQTNGQPTRLSYRELGTTGLTRFGGQIWEEKLRELRGRAGRIQYREMRMNSPVVAAIFLGIISALKQPSIRMIPASDKPPDRQAAEFIESCLADMSFTWKDTLDLILSPFLEQGFATPEIIYKRRLGPNPPGYLPEHFREKGDRPAPSRFSDGLIGWRKWAPRPAESLAEGQEWIFDAHGGVRGINQAPDVVGGQTRPLVERNVILEPEDQPPSVYSVPIEKLLHFRTTLHPANNPEGMSILRPAYIPYYYANNMQEIEGIGAERDLGGIPVIYLGEGTTLGEDPDSDWSMSKQIVTSLRSDEQAGVVFPHPKLDSQGRGILLELLSTGGRRAWDVGKIVERYEKRITLSVLAQFLMLGMEQVGSYALSSHQGDLFVLVIQAISDGIADVINRHAIPRLMAFNAFPGITGDPQLAFAPVGVPKLEELAEFVNRLAERELLTPDPELERHLRQVGGLPQPAVQVEGTPQPEDQGRDAEKTALLLRRISLAVEPLEGLGALQPGEGAALLGPLVDELRAALGQTGATDGNDFEERVNTARQRLADDIQQGIPFNKAAKEYIFEIISKHSLELVDIVCPFCGFGKANRHTGHGRKGLCVCQQCEKTYDPSYY